MCMLLHSDRTSVKVLKRRVRGRMLKALHNGEGWREVMSSTGVSGTAVRNWYGFAKRGLEPYASFLAECKRVHRLEMAKRGKLPGSGRVALSLGIEKPGARSRASTQPGKER